MQKKNREGNVATKVESKIDDTLQVFRNRSGKNSTWKHESVVRSFQAARKIVFQ